MKLFLLCITVIFLATSTEAGKQPFPAELFSKVIERDVSKNVIISPASIYTCLGLAYLGAEGTTAVELKNVLNLEGTTKEEIAKSYEEFFKRFVQGGFGDETKFSIANRVYVDKKYEISPEFDRLATKYFESTAETVDFGDAASTAERINRWVSEQTYDKITDIVSSDSIDSSTSAIMVNAIYFKGHWDNRFDVENTKKKDFFLTKTEKKSVDMMFQQDYFEYADWSEIDATAIQIPYVNTDLFMLIVLPKEVDGLKSVAEKFKTANLRALHDKFSEKIVSLHMPKFKYEYDVSMNEILSKMGIQSMFSGNADFGGLLKSKQALPISEVIHKAFIEVDEFGTEAAAATLIAVPMMGVVHTKDKTVYEFNINRPFMFAIKSQDTIYFAGQVVNV